MGQRLAARGLTRFGPECGRLCAARIPLTITRIKGCAPCAYSAHRAVRGRRRALWSSTPVTLVAAGGQRWRGAHLGEGAGGRHARVAGQVTRSHGRHADTVAIVELRPEARAPVLTRSVTAVPITRPCFDANPTSPLQAFVASRAQSSALDLTLSRVPMPDAGFRPRLMVI